MGALAAMATAKSPPTASEAPVLALATSLTLFIESGGGPLFSDALARRFDGHPDPFTLDLLQKGAF